MLLGGIHGNEKMGIKIIENLVDDLQSGKAKITKVNSEVILALGNLRAIKAETRCFESSLDLNRCFVPKYLDSPTRREAEAKRAAILAPYIQRSDLLLDIHATNKESEPFIRIAGRATNDHLQTASWFGGLKASPSGKLKLLLDPFYHIGSKPCTTDEYAGIMGGVGLCLETGIADDLSSMEEIFLRVKKLLEYEVGLEYEDDTAISDPSKTYGINRMEMGSGNIVTVPPFFDHLFEPYVLRAGHELLADGFEWEPDAGNRNWQPVSSKTVVGRDSKMNIYTVFDDSVILFPKTQELMQVGKPVYWLATKVRAHYLAGKKEALPRMPEKSSMEELEGSKFEFKFAEFIKRVIKHNSDIFLANLYSDPGLYRKSSKNRWTVVDHESQMHLSQNFGEIPMKSSMVRLPGMGSGPNAPDGYNISIVLNNFNKAEEKRLVQGSPKATAAMYPKSVMQNFLYIPKHGNNPICIYPSTLAVSGEHFTRGVAPFWSPRLALVYPVYHASKGTVLYVGIKVEDDVNRDDMIARFKAHEYEPLTLLRKQVVYIQVRVYGDAYVFFDQSATDPLYDCVKVMGNDKLAVGRTYESLRNALHLLGSEFGGIPFEFHPVFDARGGLISEFATKKKL